MTFMENLYKLVVPNIMCILQSFFILKRIKLLTTISRKTFFMVDWIFLFQGYSKKL